MYTVVEIKYFNPSQQKYGSLSKVFWNSSHSKNEKKGFIGVIKYCILNVKNLIKDNHTSMRYGKDSSMFT
jgi:hypothetical protein